MGNINNDKYRGVSIFDKQFEKNICKKIESDEKINLLQELADLHMWCQKNDTNEAVRTKLYDHFEEAIIGAYCRYKTTKAKAWAPWKNIIADCVTALVPITSGLCLFWFSKDNNWSVGNVGLIIGITLAAIWFLLVCFQTTQKRTAYRETWVRHSSCYGRLQLAMRKFLTSNREDSDYSVFVKDIFSILEQNYDQFTANLSTNGVVARRD